MFGGTTVGCKPKGLLGGRYTRIGGCTGRQAGPQDFVLFANFELKATQSGSRLGAFVTLLAGAIFIYVVFSLSLSFFFAAFIIIGVLLVLCFLDA